MSLAAFYLGLAIFFAIGTACAVIKARQVYFLVPVYFMLAWLTGELAMIHILWQVALTAVLAAGGVLEDPRAQTGLVIFALCWLGMASLHIQAMDTPQFMRAALKRALGETYRDDIPLHRHGVICDDIVSRSWLKPFHFGRDGVRKHTHISYGDAGDRNLLDVYQPVAERERPFPVLLQVHGGAWMIGKKEEQAKPLMYHMAQRGWVCVAINYRLSPAAAFPAHIIDVKKAIVCREGRIVAFSQLAVEGFRKRFNVDILGYVGRALQRLAQLNERFLALAARRHPKTTRRTRACTSAMASKASGSSVVYTS